MERIALHTRLRPGREHEYERAHAEIPHELTTALHKAGVNEWSIWRSGLELFHVLEVEDYVAMRKQLAEHPGNISWQARMAELLAVPDDYSGDDSGLRLVWNLP
jgi:L-rhamnose mutarotase